jgi:predicted enzyme related to lactoylglutathione lyase
MALTKTYPHGVPSWIDTVAHDLDEAKRFYAGLFDWTFTDAVPADAPGSYLIAAIGGQDVAAIASAESDDEPIAWRTYIAVDDADATAKAVDAAGGTVTLAPVDAGPGGRLAACVDPRGAEFRLWQARERLGAQLVNAPGTWNFSDLLTTDPHTASPFYSQVFGWEVDDIGFGTLIRRPGYGSHLAATVDPGIMARQAEASAPPGFEDAVGWMEIIPEGHPELWQVTFTVEDRDAAAATAEGLDGTVVHTEDDEWTKTATIRDPQGAQFVLSQFTPPKRSPS